MEWLREEKNLGFENYGELWKWSVGKLENFWSSIWEYYDVISSEKYSRVLSSRNMPGAKWFVGTRLNYAEHVFRGSVASHEAILEVSEDGTIKTLSWQNLEHAVSSVAMSLSERGVKKGDRVAAFITNSSEAVIGLLACASLGAIWSSCSPDFGGPSVVDRFKQIEPKALIAVDGYKYNGKEYDRTRVVEQLSRELPTLKSIVMVHRLGRSQTKSRTGVLDWEDLLSRRGTVRFERLPFDHPLWILYSSGTTGLPKPIVHGHGGILLEHLKVLSLHNDLTSNDTFFWFTTTGWMMWNYLVSSLLVGSKIVLYEGSPSYPSMNSMWELADRLGITFFGTSAAFISACMKTGIEPIASSKLSKVRGIGSTGSPLTPEAFKWIYRNVKHDVWLASVSGGTDVCTAWVGGCPLLPVVAGEIQCICLGASVKAYNEMGKEVVGELGELVVTDPMPSMPTFFWNDPDNARYLESYFAVYPRVWRHGDWIKITRRGSCIIYGRSDATIKRMGLRLGTSEVYKAVESLPEVLDSLVVDLEGLGGKPLMLLFVVLNKGFVLDGTLQQKILQKIRRDISPRYAPDKVYSIRDIPRTLNGKKLEVPVRKILLGFEKAKALNMDSVGNPESIQYFIRLANEMRASKNKSR
jgi:acetoacetyl-CoA synthetase